MTLRPPERRTWDMREAVKQPNRPLEDRQHRAKLHGTQAPKMSSPEEFVRAWLLQIIARQKLNSAAQLAKLAGVAPSTVTRAVDPNSPIVPSGRTLAKIAQKTGYCLFR